MNKLISRLIVVYGQPESTDPVAYLREIEKAIERFDDHTLDRAADVVLRTHKRAFFPSPAVIIQACEEMDALRVKPFRDDQVQYSRCLIAPPSYAELTRNRLAKEWRDNVCAEYDSVDEYLRKTVNIRSDGSNGAYSASKKSTFSQMKTDRGTK